MTRLPEKYAPVMLRASRSIRATLPWKTTWPPLAPGSGPISITWSAARIMTSSCSTTTTVLPASTSERMIATSLPMSLVWRPTLGSSMTKSVSTSDVPRQLVRLTRSTSPPESVLDGRSGVR